MEVIWELLSTQCKEALYNDWIYWEMKESQRAENFMPSKRILGASVIKILL